METNELRTEDVAAVYDDLHAAHEQMWDQDGHKSIHLGQYDDEHDDPTSAAINAIRFLADAADVGPGDRVLDIGCGAGQDAVWNARNRDATVVGVNISEPQLEVAREHARENDVENRVAFRYDDFHELRTVGDDSVDVFWGLEALTHAADDSQVMEQARRVLVDGGTVALADMFRRSGDLSASTRERLETVHDGAGARIEPIADLEAALESNGFDDVEVRDRTDAVGPAARRRYYFSLLAYPACWIGNKLGLRSDAHVGLYATSYHLYKLFESDALGYYVVTATL